MRFRLAGLAGALFVTSLLAQSPPPSFPVPSPLTGYAGRLVDSIGVRDFMYPVRTLRSDLVKIAPELDYIFMKAGGCVFGAYRLSTFASKIGGPLITLSPAHPFPPTERYLPFDMSVDPQRMGSGWAMYFLDGQDRLYDFDWDDRGYIYLAYSEWGFGIVNLQGQLISQVTNSPYPANPIAIVAFTMASGGEHYLVVSDGQTSSAIYNVTNPAAPSL